MCDKEQYLTGVAPVGAHDCIVEGRLFMPVDGLISTGHPSQEAEFSCFQLPKSVKPRNHGHCFMRPVKNAVSKLNTVYIRGCKYPRRQRIRNIFARSQ
jgi:hypothetical protein